MIVVPLRGVWKFQQQASNKKNGSHIETEVDIDYLGREVKQRTRVEDEKKAAFEIAQSGNLSECNEKILYD